MRTLLETRSAGATDSPDHTSGSGHSTPVAKSAAACGTAVPNCMLISPQMGGRDLAAEAWRRSSWASAS
eukprot:1626209-Alexandrium_andersonii.AAC.1